MKIGIDCRMFGPKHTGIGRYTQNLVEELLAQDETDDFVLFVRGNKIPEIENLKFRYSLKIENSKLKIVETNISHYSLNEQLFLPRILAKEKLDLMHFPHFNVPVFFQGKYIVTIHDLIKHSSKGKETTTKSGWIYWLKYFGYKFVFKQSVRRAFRIITPSKFVKNEIIKEYKISEDKIKVTYEGVDNRVRIYNFETKNLNETLERYGIKKPFLLYVGSVYPHKNIERLIEAVLEVKIPLVVVCARNVFSERLSKTVTQMGAGEFINLVGFVSNQDLAIFYKEAEAFIFPTLAEGFGLPGLEAMSLDCPVLCSDIPVLREVYKDSAIFFNPLNINDIAEKIKIILSDKELKKKLINSGLDLAKTYSWSKTARETLDVYRKV